MTRIIAGFARSRVLKVPRQITRPTSDRVREALFSALEARGVIEGARVCDLYAGSGALGLEALSRGAESVTLVEKNSAAAAVAQANARIVIDAGNRLPQCVNVFTSSVTSFLNKTTQEWDLVFIDPPYEISLNDVQVVLEKLSSHLSQNAVVVLERPSRNKESNFHDAYELQKSNKYGETTLHWLGPLRETSGS